MIEVLYISLLSIVMPITYLAILYLKLPTKSFRLDTALTYVVFGTLSVPLLLTFFKIFPNWNSMSNHILMISDDNDLYLHIKYYVEVGFIEEFSKLILFILVTNFRKNNFNNISDEPIAIMVYCGMISLGFGIVENTLYSMNYENPINILGWRGFTALIGHLLFGLYMGYFISKGRSSTYKDNELTIFLNKYKTIKKYVYIIIGLIVSVILHGLYNLHLISNEPNGISGVYVIFVSLIIGLILMVKDLREE